MSEKLAFEIYYIELWHIFSVLFIVIVNLYIYFNARKNSLLYSYLAVEALLFIWLISKIFKTVSPNPDIRWFFIVTQYVGNCFLGPAFFAFAHTYATGKLPCKNLLVLTNLPALFFFLSMASNPWHMLFYSYYDYFRDSFGPLFYLHQVYSYSLMLIGTFLCGKQFFLEFHHRRIQAVIISMAVLIPLFANIFYILKLFKPIFGFRPLFDITPITCNISLALFAIGTFKYRFFDITTIAWRKVLNQIPEGIMLIQNDKTIADMNQTSAKTPEADEIIKKVWAKASQTEPLDFMYTATTGKVFRVSWIPYSRRHRNKGYVLRFIDDTAYQQALQTLSDKNQVLMNINRILSIKASTKQSLAVYKTRNFIGREVHDLLGHSIVLALAVLEVARISLTHDLSAAKDKFVQGMEVIKKAKEQMDHTLVNSFGNAVTKKNNLINEIKRLVDETSLTGQNVNLTIQGHGYEVPKHISDSVFRLCQEAITNAIRHGKADKINIILRYNRTQLEIYIIDNGMGCTKIIKGYGLTGMEERIVDSLGGVLDYGSLEGGFTIRAAVPLSAS